MKYLSISTDVKDSNGGPMLFSIDEDYGFSVSMQPGGDMADWVRHDLIDTSQGLKAQTFAVSQASDGTIYLVLAAGADVLGPSQLFLSAGLPNDPNDLRWQVAKQSWRSLQTHPDASLITELLLVAPEQPGELPMIVFGTEELAGKTPKYYRIKTVVATQGVEPFPNLANADELLDIVPARHITGQGVYVLYRRGQETVLEYDGVPNEYNISISATLATPPGALELESRINLPGLTDLYVTGNGQFVFTSDNQRSQAQAKMVTADDGVDITKRISSRSSITQDYHKEAGSGKFIPSPVYRTSISLPPTAVFAYLWASEEVSVEVNGQTYLINPVKPANLKIPDGHKLSVSMPATELRCPSLLLRTNTMRPEQRHVICPDVEAHKKITSLEDGALYNARKKLGIRPEYTKEHVDSIQKAVQSLTQTIQYTYNRKPHGVHHDRAVLPQNMIDPHFILDFQGGQAQYRALQADEVRKLTAGATIHSGQAAQGWDDIGNLFVQAGSIIVHTAESIGNEAIDVAENVYSDVKEVWVVVHEDLVHGDYRKITQDLIQGGENIRRVLFTGAANVVGDLISGAGQLVCVTFKLAKQTVQLILNNTGEVGKAVGAILEKIGAALGKVVDWILDAVGWNEVLHAQAVIKEQFNRNLDQVKNVLESFKAQAGQVSSALKDNINQNISAQKKQLKTHKLIEQPHPPQGYSTGAEKSEWLFTHFSIGSNAITVSKALNLPLASLLPKLDALLAVLQDKFGDDLHILYEALVKARELLIDTFRGSLPSLDDLWDICLQLAQGMALLAIGVLTAALEALIDLMEDFIDYFSQVINAPINIPFVSDLYASLTNNSQLTLLDFTALIIALPANIISRISGGSALFEGVGLAAASLPDPDKDALLIRDWGRTYGSVRIIQGLSAVVVDVWSTVEGSKDAKNYKRANTGNNTFHNVRSWVRGTRNDPAQKVAGNEPQFITGNIMALISFIADMIALAGASPVGHGDLGKGEYFNMLQPPPSTDIKDSLKASNYWGHVTWYIDFTTVFISAVLSLTGFITSRVAKTEDVPGTMSDIQAGVACVLGALSVANMSAMDVYDRLRMKYIKTTYFELDGDEYKTSSDKSWQGWSGWTWYKPDAQGQEQKVYYVPKEAFTKLEPGTQEEYALFLKWAEQGGMDQPPQVAGVNRLWGIERKGFANVISGFSGIGQVGLIEDIVVASEGYSVLATLALDLLGLGGEGITHLVRTNHNELF